MSATEKEMAFRRIFELHVSELIAESEDIDELLLVRLRYFGEDINNVINRLAENPRMVVELIHHLSTKMQEIDTTAGESSHAQRSLSKVRSMALLLPETAAAVLDNGDDNGEGDKG